MKTAQEAYWEACRGINIKENEKIVINSKNATYCYCFANTIPGANIQELENIVLKYGDPLDCYSFVKYVSDSNIKSHEQLIVNHPTLKGGASARSKANS